MISIVAVFVTFLTFWQVAWAIERPNFILIFCDDLGFGDLKSYGHPYAETPNIDRLAKEGTVFRQFHVNGNVCPVTRAGLMTSRNPSWFPNYTEDYGFMGQPTVTNVLQDSGYTTAHIGKWNIGPDPEKDAVEYGIDYMRFTGSIPNDPRGREGLRIDETLKFLEQHKDEAFYLNLWLYSTHLQIDPPESFIDHFRDLKVDRTKFGQHMQEKFDMIESENGDIDKFMHIYLGEVLALDTQVGRLLDKLDDLKLTDNTVVVFSSDNGPENLKSGRFEALGYSGGLRGAKHSFYEGGTRVPFLVRWPNHVPAGRVDDQSIISGLDWLPTVASLARADIPWHLIEGEDMSDVWLGNTRSRTNPLFFRMLQSHSRVYVRYGRWKLLKVERELYDLWDDPEERINIYNERSDVVAALIASTNAWEATLPTGHARLPDQPLPYNPEREVIDVLVPNIPDSFPFAGRADETSSGPTTAPNEPIQESVENATSVSEPSLSPVMPTETPNDQPSAFPIPSPSTPSPSVSPPSPSPPPPTGPTNARSPGTDTEPAATSGTFSNKPSFGNWYTLCLCIGSTILLPLLSTL